MTPDAPYPSPARAPSNAETARAASNLAAFRIDPPRERSRVRGSDGVDVVTHAPGAVLSTVGRVDVAPLTPDGRASVLPLETITIPAPEIPAPEPLPKPVFTPPPGLDPNRLATIAGAHAGDVLDIVLDLLAAVADGRVTAAEAAEIVRKARARLKPHVPRGD